MLGVIGVGSLCSKLESLETENGPQLPPEPHFKSLLSFEHGSLGIGWTRLTSRALTCHDMGQPYRLPAQCGQPGLRVGESTESVVLGPRA